jgi:signal transduction histidine kinase
MNRQRVVTFLLLCLAGVVIGTLGTWSVPLGHGYSALWPALVVQVAGGIWFGTIGILAGTVFPIFSNALAHVGPVGILGYIPANLAQSFIPAWAFRNYKMDPAIPGRKGILFYMLWGAVIPSLVGAILGSAAVVLMGEATVSEYPRLIWLWALGHIVVSPIVGIPALRVFTPLWRDLGVLVTGWWSSEEQCGAGARLRFRDMPIKAKLVLAMFTLGMAPLLSLAAIEFAKNDHKSLGGQGATPALLTLALVATTLAIGWLSAEVIRPLKDLRKKVESLIDSDNASLTVSRQDEIGDVGRAFETLLQERRRVEAAALRDQKLQHLGMLAGGIAHDFNNLLQSIMLNATMAQTEVPPETKAHGYLVNIENIAERAAQVTGELLRFSREQAAEPRIVDLNSLAQETTDISMPLLNGKISFTLALSPYALLVQANPAHIEQVMLNLILNARDAMPLGGRLSVETGTDRAGQRVFLRVSDTGVGIPDNVKAQMFEPFFTTKSAGKGTGLGLAIVSDIVRRSNGEIQVDSKVGHGTVFTVLLPRHESQREAQNVN